MASILLIDDDIDIRPLMNTLLTRLGHTPRMAASGEEGLKLAQESQFDLVILDLMMPGMDGFEVCRRLRAHPRTRDIPILIFTARTQPADQEGAMQAGADGFLGKPIEPRELSAKISELLAGSGARARPAEASPVAAGAKAEAPAEPEPAIALNCRVLVVLGLRGGVGATTFAVNLAGGLVRAERRVCLMDLSPAGGLAALQLGLRPKASWADLPPKPDLTSAGAVLVRHISGLFLVPAPPEPTRKSLPKVTLQLTLDALDGVFGEMVIRAAPVLDDATTEALRLARLVCLVVAPEIGAVQTAIGTLSALQALAIPNHHVRIVLNQTMAEPILSPGRVEKALGRPVDLTIPYDPAQAVAFAQGSPLILSQPSAPLAAAVQGFVIKL
jgi:pilus assembly protein CpaE